jgi:hypothetical protein
MDLFVRIVKDRRIVECTHGGKALGGVIHVRRPVVRLGRVLRRERTVTIPLLDPAALGLASVGEVCLGVAPPAIEHGGENESEEEEDYVGGVSARGEINSSIDDEEEEKFTEC